MIDYIQHLVEKALGAYHPAEPVEFTVEKPKNALHGDASTNAAMLLTKILRKNPREIAKELIDILEIDSSVVSKVEIAGPGFINFWFSEAYVQEQLQKIIKSGIEFGKGSSLKNKKVLVEFVSANPTGPLTVGHGRNAVLGDTIARLLEWNGAEVQREYYFNDAGRQMRMLGLSVKTRYLEELGQEVKLPEGCYEGEYIRDIAKTIHAGHGESWAAEESETPFTKVATEAIFKEISATLERMNIRMDTYFNEHTLYESGEIDNVVSQLRSAGLAYDAEGAVWFKTTEFGKEKDTVLIKSSGEPTYRLPDIAYHAEKLGRGYDLCVDVFGADHISTYPDVLSGLQALGYDTSRVDVVVYQFVTIVKDGKPYKMSTRKANFITLDELMDEVGVDVARFFFLMRSPNTHLEFDIAQAKEAGEKNPVFYLQYAHARIASILRKAKEEMGKFEDADYSKLIHPAETGLIKGLLQFPATVESAAQSREPHRVIIYLNELASLFTSFYHDCRIMGEEEELAKARVFLAKATAQVLKNGLSILGVSAPERM